MVSLLISAGNTVNVNLYCQRCIRASFVNGRHGRSSWQRHVYVRREVRLQSVFVFELPAAENAGISGLLAAGSQVRVHRRLAKVDFAAYPARKHRARLICFT